MGKRFIGKILDEETGEVLDVDTEAYDESPDYVTIPTEDGGKLVGIDSPIAEEGIQHDFYVGTVETEDGREIEINSDDLNDELMLVDDEDSTDNEDEDDSF